MRSCFNMDKMGADRKSGTEEEREKIETEMEDLLFFLENVDFSYLRQKYPQLSGIENISVVLQINRNSSSNNQKEHLDADNNVFNVTVDSHVLPCKNR